MIGFHSNFINFVPFPHASSTSGGADGWDTIHTGVF